MKKESVQLLIALLVWLPAAAQVPTSAGDQAVDAVTKARENLRAAEAAHPGSTVEVGKALNDLVSTQLDGNGPEKDSVELAQRGLKVSEAAAGAESEMVVFALSNLAEVYIYLSRPAEARPHAEHALEIAEKKYPGSDSAIEAARALGRVCDVLTDFPCALRADEVAIAAERTPGPEHEWELGASLSNLGNVKMRMGDTAGAGAAIEEALAHVKHAHPDNPQICVLESNLGVFYMRSLQFSEALPHLNQAIETAHRFFGPDSPIAARAYINLAELYTRYGQFPLAWKSYEIALINAQVTADELAREQGAFARSLAAGGDFKRAIDQGLLAEKMGRETFTLQARILPERQALAYQQNRPSGLQAALSVVARHPEMPSDAVYLEVVRSRALVADEMARRQKDLNAANDPAVARLLEELKSAQAALLKADAAPPAAKGYQDTVSAAQSQVEKIECSLAERSGSIRNQERVTAVGLEDLRRNLPAHAVLISYVAYKRMAVATVDPARMDVASYLAFVLNPATNQIKVFDLGDAKPIEEMVQRLRLSADSEARSGGLDSVRNERAYREAGETLRKQVWDPLQAELKDAKLALVVPDGLLNLIPFSGLPEGKGYLADGHIVIHTLSSERDLIPDAGETRKTGLLAIGGPAFDLATNATPALKTQEAADAEPLSRSGPLPVLRDSPISCDAFHKLEFHALPGAQAEVNDISSTWRRWNNAEPSELLTGADATRNEFLVESSRSRVLHVATHAFLLDRRCGEGNPLLHSGLVFAGANRNRESSILTAQQIASLDLNGVDLAVLSACNTGNGELSDGEGVLGLERAFHIAGARSVVMTIWPVDDRVTVRYMHELYASLLVRHESIADAVWNSQHKLLTKRRAAGQSTHPWYWAGFVGSGWQ